MECQRLTCKLIGNTSGFCLTIRSDDWTKFTDYRGYEMNDEVIQWFWKCVRSWPPERKSRLLQFATGTSRIPVNGFKDLQGSDGPRRFTIEKSGDPSQLPKSHTCFNRIDLPPYKDYASLEHKLTLAVEYVVSVICDDFLLTFWLGKLLGSGKSEERTLVLFTIFLMLYRRLVDRWLWVRGVKRVMSVCIPAVPFKIHCVIEQCALLMLATLICVHS